MARSTQSKIKRALKREAFNALSKVEKGSLYQSDLRGLESAQRRDTLANAPMLGTIKQAEHARDTFGIAELAQFARARGIKLHNTPEFMPSKSTALQARLLLAIDSLKDMGDTDQINQLKHLVVQIKGAQATEAIKGATIKQASKASKHKPNIQARRLSRTTGKGYAPIKADIKLQVQRADQQARKDAHIKAPYISKDAYDKLAEYKRMIAFLELQTIDNIKIQSRKKSKD